MRERPSAEVSPETVGKTLSEVARRNRELTEVPIEELGDRGAAKGEVLSVDYVGRIGGVEFPGGKPATYFDFAYLAFTLGMTFQVSDTAITSAAIRRTALLHAAISFAYNTAILAFVLNLVFGFVSAG